MCISSACSSASAGPTQGEPGKITTLRALLGFDNTRESFKFGRFCWKKKPITSFSLESFLTVESFTL